MHGKNIFYISSFLLDSFLQQGTITAMGFLLAAGITHWSAFTSLVAHITGTANDVRDSFYMPLAIAESVATSGMIICCVSWQTKYVQGASPNKYNNFCPGNIITLSHGLLCHHIGLCKGAP